VLLKDALMPLITAQIAKMLLISYIKTYNHSEEIFKYC